MFLHLNVHRAEQSHESEAVDVDGGSYPENGNTDYGISPILASIPWMKVVTVVGSYDLFFTFCEHE